jgi:uncharacterized protein
MTARSQSKHAKPAIDSRYACFRLRMRRSPIHGWGVFAEEGIPAGRKVIEYTGERISRVESRRRFVRAWNRGGDRRIYIAAVSSYWNIDPARGGSGAERINHSCEPNLFARRIRGRLFYFCRRAVRPGEELSVDYAFPKDGPKVPCHCGAPGCRGTLNLR